MCRSLLHLRVRLMVAWMAVVSGSGLAGTLDESGFSMSLPLMLNEQFVAECEGIVSQDGTQVWLKQSDLLSHVLEAVSLETVSDIESAVVEGYVSLRSLSAAGLITEFDSSALSVSLMVPPSLRREQTLSMRGGASHDSLVPRVSSAEFSGYTNVRTLMQGRFGNDADGSEMIPRFDLEQVLNYRGWAFAMGGKLSPGEKQLWRQGASSMSLDIPEKRLQYAVGELSTRAVAYQDPVAFLGLSLAREWRLQPFNRAQPTPGSTLFLEEDSQVEVRVNGHRVRSFDLKAGPYQIRDFQLSAGSTDVELLITDAYGVETTKNLSFAFDDQLLAPGQRDFYLGAGLLPEQGGRAREYDVGLPVVSGFLRTGRSNVLTTGWNVQASSERTQVGADGIWAVGSGTFLSQVSLSYDVREALGYGVRVAYLHYARRGLRDRHSGNWRVDLGHQSGRFAGIISEPGTAPLFDARVSYSKPLPWRMSGSIGLGYRRGRAGSRSGANGRVSLTKRWAHGLSSHVSFSTQAQRERGQEWGMSFRLEWAFGNRQQHRLASGVDTRRGSRQLRYMYTPRSQWEQWRYSGTVDQQTSGDWGGDFRAGVSRSRMEWDVGQSLRSGVHGTTGTTRVSMGTALAFADGHWGISKPINDSFVIVAGHESLKGRTVPINERDQGTESKLDRWGPAVIGSVPSYYPRHVEVHPPADLPFGYDIGADRYLVETTSRRGAVISIGSEPTKAGTGQVILDDGSPLSLQVGDLLNLDREEDSSETVFTGRDGKFTVDGLRPGQYRIQWFDEAYEPCDFEVVEEEGELINLGVLSTKLRETEELVF